MVKALIFVAARETVAVLRQNVVAAILYLVAAVVALAAIGFLLLALYLWLGTLYSPIIASLIIAGGLFAVALIIAVIGMTTRRRRRRRTAEIGEIIAALTATKAAVSGRRGAGTFAILAVIAGGLLLGRKAKR